MQRVAWFTPVPPVRSGITRYSLELIPRLAPDYAIDLFVESVDGSPPDGAEGMFSAHDFVWKQTTDPYDLVVYQLGNSTCHDYMWPYLVRYPGLVVLHDGQLYHSRARALLQQNRAEDYRTEFRYSHPETDARVAELGLTGLMGSLAYLWPMRRVILDSARGLLVHNAWLAEQVRREAPPPTGPRVHVVEMGVPDLTHDPNAVARLRYRHGIAPDAVLLALFGKITPEKRVSQVLRALAACGDHDPPAHLMLCGELVDHYAPQAEATAFGVEDRVTVTGYVAENDLPSYIAASDICLCLRWPSSRETSASWLRCLAAGKATVVTDLVQQANIPGIDPRDWSVAGYPGGRNVNGDEVRPACVAIDILDEDHSLTLALRRLIVDTPLRHVVGEAGRQLWRDRFTLDRMAQGYDEALRATCGARRVPARRSGLPAHLSPDGTELLRRILGTMNVSVDF